MGGWGEREVGGGVRGWWGERVVGGEVDVDCYDTLPRQPIRGGKYPPACTFLLPSAWLSCIVDRV